MYSGRTMVMRNGGFEIFFWGVGELFGTIKFMNLFFRRASEEQRNCINLIEVENAAILVCQKKPTTLPELYFFSVRFHCISGMVDAIAEIITDLDLAPQFQCICMCGTYITPFFVFLSKGVETKGRIFS